MTQDAARDLLRAALDGIARYGGDVRCAEIIGAALPHCASTDEILKVVRQGRGTAQLAQKLEKIVIH